MRRTTRLAAVLAVMTLSGAGMRAQDSGGWTLGAGRGERGQMNGMQRVDGEVTAVAGSTLTVKTQEGGMVQVVTTENTRVMKGRGITVKVGDLKVGDGVVAAGNLDAPNKTMHAAVVFAVDAAQVKAMKENLGKTYIVGRVTGVDMDNAKMTVERPDHVSQTIGLDEGTSFKKFSGRGMRMGAGAAGGGMPNAGAGAGGSDQGGESITLADIKVGEEVRGTGSVKGGVFVPTEVVVFERRPRSEGDAATGGKARPGVNPNPQ